MCMGVISLLVCMCVVHLQCPQRPEGVGFLGTEIRDGCESQCGCQELNLALLEEQPAFLIALPSLQPQKE